MTQTELKEFFMFKLSQNPEGLTSRQLAQAADLDPTKTRHFDVLSRMVELNVIEKINSVFFITHYGLSTLKSALTQNEKMPIETPEPAPIVEESALEQNEKLGGEVIEAAATPLTDVEIAEIEKQVIKESLPSKKMNPDEFKIWQIIEQAGLDFITILNSKKAKPIENIEYKIATLESLADIYNPKISATLREIAVDLRG